MGNLNSLIGSLAIFPSAFSAKDTHDSATSVVFSDCTSCEIPVDLEVVSGDKTELSAGRFVVLENIRGENRPVRLRTHDFTFPVFH
jgi:hypothetical protein